MVKFTLFITALMILLSCQEKRVFRNAFKEDIERMLIIPSGIKPWKNCPAVKEIGEIKGEKLDSFLERYAGMPFPCVKEHPINTCNTALILMKHHRVWGNVTLSGGLHTVKIVNKCYKVDSFETRKLIESAPKIPLYEIEFNGLECGRKILDKMEAHDWFVPHNTFGTEFIWQKFEGKISFIIKNKQFNVNIQKDQNHKLLLNEAFGGENVIEIGSLKSVDSLNHGTWIKVTAYVNQEYDLPDEIKQLKPFTPFTQEKFQFAVDKEVNIKESLREWGIDCHFVIR